MSRRLLFAIELIVVGVVVLATRCANYREIFVGGEIYFVDADCYARMTRARICFEHPGTVVRHHSFENYPPGTSPHTTAPFDYAIVAIAELLRPFSTRALELSGAFISPLIALAGAWFLCWWARRIRLRFRWAMLLLFSVSPMLVHATSLGRPDHQSVLVVLIVIAICAEWSMQRSPSLTWSVVGGATWALALWVSLYEPLVLLASVLVWQAIVAREKFTARDRRIGWLVFGAISMTAVIVERRALAFPSADEPFLRNWLSTIGELHHASLSSFSEWCGWLVILAPVLLVVAFRRTVAAPVFVVMLATLTFALTLWQARWGYFFVAIFSLLVPSLLASIRSARVAILLFTFSLWPIAQAWDAMLWPNDSEIAARAEHFREIDDCRAAANSIARNGGGAFVAPWWWSPAIAYWSGANGVAGSSHESLPGIVATARLYLTDDAATAQQIFATHQVHWLVAYDSERTTSTAAAILGTQIPPQALGVVFDRMPSRAPPFLRLAYQNATFKVFAAQKFP